MVINNNMLNNWGLLNGIEPYSAEIFYEKGKPYMKYVGRALLDTGNNKTARVELTFPKISLNFTTLEIETDSNYIIGQYNNPIHKLWKLGNAIISDDKNALFYMEIIEEDVTKKDIEDKFGHRVNIVD